MIDIHMHVLPDVDDGAIDLTMAKQMIDMSYAQGVRGIIATPHGNSYRLRRKQADIGFAQLQDYISKNYPDMCFALGSEIYFDMPYLPDTLYQLKKGRIPTLNGTSYILSEFSPYAETNEVRYILSEIIKEGFTPIIAHAERTPYAFSDMQLVYEVISMGCMIQVNAYSLSEETNNTIRNLAQKLLKNELIHFIGSDAHRTTHRAPKLRKGIDYIRVSCSKEYAEQILSENAKKFLTDI